MHCLHLQLFVVLSFTISLLGGNKVRENINAVLISEVQFSFHSHAMSGSLTPFSLFSFFDSILFDKLHRYGERYLTTNCYAYKSKSETNSQSALPEHMQSLTGLASDELIIYLCGKFIF